MKIIIIKITKIEEEIELASEQGKVVELDVRDDIKNKLEPFQKIMDAVKSLEKGDSFILHAPFKPAPLFPILKKKGFNHVAEEVEKKHWKVTFTHRGDKE